MTPQTYNAYYNPSNNEIVLPAAIFILPGIADSLVDDAIVYAYAGGTTIGHEITHGFDDLAWDAFKKTDEYKSGKKIGGLTPAQRYFVGWSLGWMNQLRPENLAVRVKTDVHSPSPFRTIGPVTSMVPFYEAFGVKPGDKMYRPDSVRAKIW